MTLATRLKAIRLVHNYLGVFFAPTILFFAITGALQMFGLHESSRGSAYNPPRLLVRLAQLHKKGTLSLPPNKKPSATVTAKLPDISATAAKDAPKPADASKPADVPPKQVSNNPLPMKIFFVATAWALVLSTFTGLIMAWQYARRKLVVVAIFVAGILCPLIALAL